MQAKAAESKIQGDRKWTAKKIKIGIEQILCQNGIDVAKYHGGTYEGVTLLKLMRKLDDVFCDIVRYLKDELEKDATYMMCTTEEIEEVCGHYKELLGLINGTFTMLRIKSDDIKDEDYDIAERFVRALLQKCRAFGFSVTPKMHSIEDHAIAMMRFLKGLGDFCKDFIEQAHQDTAWESKLTNRLANKQKASDCIASREALKENPDVVAAMEKVKNACSRKRKSAVGDKKLEAKRVRHMNLLKILEEFERSDASKIPNGFERSFVDVRLND